WSIGSIASGTTGLAQRGRSADKLLLLLQLLGPVVERQRDRLADLVAVLVLALVGEHGVEVVALVDELAHQLRRRAAVVVVAGPGRRDLDRRHDDDVAEALGVLQQLLLDVLA